LNDIDFITPALRYVPETLTDDFLIRHVHPLDAPGKTILQLVDPETRLRINLFRACNPMLTSTLSLGFSFGQIQLISGEDVVAHAARILLELRVGAPVAGKHANNYLRLAGLIHIPDLEAAWHHHRKPDHPKTFEEVNSLVRSSIASHSELLITPDYSQDATQICPRCVPLPAFPLADPHLVLALLGYW